MSLFKPKNSVVLAPAPQPSFAEMVLNVIHDGVIAIAENGTIQFINPAALAMCGFTAASQVINLDYGLVLRLEDKNGEALNESNSPLIRAVRSRQPLEKFECYILVARSDKKIPVSISAFPSGGSFVVTFRDITKELQEEGEQTEFISTASHEMRTPVATIDGYLSLALNPQTATIDDRARGYLDAAHTASQHLGKLFQDLLDVTKLDDGRIRPQFKPVEMMSTVAAIVKDYAVRANEKKLKLSFGSEEPAVGGGVHRLEQVTYGYIDPDFLREIMDNIIDNAIKYTPEGGSVNVSVRGDGNNTLITVRDTGMGISADDLGHIFQKFYRADNSDTRTIGGTGLGLYLVKQRVEAMGGRVWAESVFGEGSVFYVSLPRISVEEYEKRMIPIRNAALREQAQRKAPAVTQAEAPVLPQVQPQAQVQPQQISPPPAPPAPPAPPTPQLINNNLNGEPK